VIVVGTSQGMALTVRLNRNGTLDQTFGGGDGVTTTDLGLRPEVVQAGESGRSSLTVSSVAVDPAGHILISGSAYKRPAYCISDWGGYVARFNEDGMLDPSFGLGGVVAYPANEPNSSDNLTMSQHGTLLFSGILGGCREYAMVGVMLGRLTATGARDEGFGKFGQVTLDWVRRIAIDGSGRIVVLGLSRKTHPASLRPPDIRAKTVSRVTRLLPSGALDRSFGTEGTATIRLVGGESHLTDLAVTKGGGILVAGTKARYFRKPGAVPRRHGVMVRLTPHGSLDRRFGKAGFVQTRVARGWNTAARQILLGRSQRDAIVATPFENPGTKRGGLALLAYSLTR
jgi:uncharacterized delta-60 repeat protein